MRDIARFLYEMGQLKRVRRSGWWVVGINDPESVAEHSFRVAVIGYVLAHLEGADPLKTALMCLFHDAHESRLSDLHRLARRYVDPETAEDQAFSEQVDGLPQGIPQELTALICDFHSGTSLESRVACDADRLECLIQAREYQAQGCQGLQEWIRNSRAALVTESAQRIATECLHMEPQDWSTGLSARPLTGGS